MNDVTALEIDFILMFLAFIGCDGSGKSAVIAEVSARLMKQGFLVTRGHWRPVATRMESSDGAAVTADDPHGQMPRGVISSVLKMGWLLLNWWLGWWKFLRKASSEGVVLFDRYHADLLVDPRRYRYGGPMWLARMASRLMPQPDVVIFLDAEPEVLLSRKQEVSHEALLAARENYLDLCADHPRFHIIDCSQPLKIVIKDVMELVGLIGSNP